MSKVLLLFFLISNYYTVVAKDVNVKVHFYKEGKAVNDKQLSFFIVVGDSNKKVIIQPKIDAINNSFIMPETCGYNTGFIIFKYRKRVYAISIDEFTFADDMVWTFYFDKKPYDREYYFGENSFKENKAISILKIDKSGNSTGVVKRIYNVSQYFKEGERLISTN